MMASMVRHRILVVEDDAAVRRMYRTALGFAGFTVVEAEDGLSALQHLEDRVPDLVILDLMLPTVSGFIVRQEIAAHARTRDIPIVVVTGSEMNLDDLAVPCILRKPVSPDQLLNTVENLITNH
jgi:CheY-like chemotaxis protein